MSPFFNYLGQLYLALKKEGHKRGHIGAIEWVSMGMLRT
jgi:hypothetical protein